MLFFAVLWPVLLAACYVLVSDARRRSFFDRLRHVRSKKDGDAVDFLAQTAAVESVFNMLNVDFDAHSDDDEKNYRFDYQSGHFTLTCPRATSRGMRLLYPGFVSAPLDSIDSVRMMCNEANCRSYFVSAVYVVNDKENEVTAHLTARLAATSDPAVFMRDLKQAAGDCFGLHRFAAARLESMIEASHNFNISDFEYHFACDKATENILVETENWHTGERYGLVCASEACARRLSVNNVLSHIFSPLPGRFTHLEATADGYHVVLAEPGEILSYFIGEPLVGAVSDGDTVDCFRNSRGFVYLQFEQFDPDTENPDGVTLGVWLMLEAVKVTGERLFFRLTYTMPQHLSVLNVSRSAIEAVENPCSGSMLLSYDLVDCKKRRAEFRFMRLDAIDKYAEGKGGECSPEQQLIHGLTDKDAGYNIYWGHRLMREKLYLEASIRLGRAWSALNEEYPTLGRRDRSTYFRVCYLMGLCLMHLGFDKEACYYLRLTEGENNSDYFMALVNCMAKLRDPRVLNMVRHAMRPLSGHIHELQEEGGDVPEHLADLLNFLRRREVFIEIDRGYLDEAETICRQMLNEPENSDYALSELAYMQKLRGNGVKSRAPLPEDEDIQS